MPVPCFLLFLYFRKVVQKIFSELDETKAEVNILPKRRRSPEGGQRGATGRPHLPLARPSLGPRQGLVWAPQVPHRPESFAYLYIFSGKPWIPEPPSTKSSVVAAIEEPISGGSEALPGTLPEGEIIAGGIYIAMPASEVMCE